MGRNFGVDKTKIFDEDDLRESNTVMFWVGVAGGIVITHLGWFLAAWTLGWV